MPELEDLRNRSFVWQVDVLHQGRCSIFEGLREVGYIQQESWWRRTYSAELAGLRWKLRYSSSPFRNALSIDFADGKGEIALACRAGPGLQATLDSVHPYRLERNDRFRAVWRDTDGFGAVSIGAEENKRMRFDWIRHGPIRTFEVCPIPHAPILVLLGTVEVVYGRFFISQNTGLVGPFG